MAVERDTNYVGQERLDAPLLRLAESGVRADFDALAGTVLSGRQPLVVRGFLVGSYVTGTQATNLVLNVKDGVILHYGATAAGTIFVVPPDRELERLSSVDNSRVVGSYQPSSENYIGIDFRREPDDSTAAECTFWDPDLQEEVKKTVPLGRTADYRIIISSEPFEATPLSCPLVIVTTDAYNKVVSVVDARNLAFRLGRGGSVPNDVASWSWPQGRKELSGSPFLGGDKAIQSLREWVQAAMSRIWEIGGGERWSSAVADRNVRYLSAGTAFANGEFFTWDGTDLLWQGLQYLLSNSGGIVNQVADQTSPKAGLTDLADLECIYVDLDYRQSLTGGSAIVAAKAPLQSLGAPQLPLARNIIAWRFGSYIYTRDRDYPVGQDPVRAFRDSLTSIPLYQRTILSCTTPDNLVVEPLGTFYVTEGGSWVAITNSTQTTINVAMAVSLSANTRYYVYAKSTAGVFGFEVNTTAPDATLRWMSGPDTSRAFVGTVATNGVGSLYKFRSSGGTYDYIGAPNADSSLQILSGGSSTATATRPYDHRSPPFHLETVVAVTGNSTVANRLNVEPVNGGSYNELYVVANGTNFAKMFIPRGDSNGLDYNWNTTTGTAYMFVLGFKF